MPPPWGLLLLVPLTLAVPQVVNNQLWEEGLFPPAPPGPSVNVSEEDTFLTSQPEYPLRKKRDTESQILQLGVSADASVRAARSSSESGEPSQLPPIEQIEVEGDEIEEVRFRGPCRS